MFKKFKKIKYNSGMTIIELLVVLAIFAIISSITMFDYASFKSSVSLNNLTNDIALSIRKAQSYAIGAHGVGPNNARVFNNSYGINFSASPNIAPSLLLSSRKSFLMFSNTSKIYIPNNTCGENCCDSSENDCVEIFTINTPDYIKGIWLDGVKKTSVDEGNLDIVFTRPDPRAYFCYKAYWNSEFCDQTPISNVNIVVSNGQTDSTKEKCKMIKVQNTGQISIEPNDCN